MGKKREKPCPNGGERDTIVHCALRVDFVMVSDAVLRYSTAKPRAT